MFVRYVVNTLDAESHRRLGVILAAHDLRAAFDWQVRYRLERLIDWFNEYLSVPPRFTHWRSRYGRRRAICWFKDSARSFIVMVRRIATTLEEQGIATQMLKTRKPGYIVYEDRHQVAAIPFRDTIC